MDKINKRNHCGLKDSIHCYITIKGVQYEQWRDAIEIEAYDKAGAKRALKAIQIERPNDQFIIRLINKEFYRIYRKETSNGTKN